MAEKPNVKRHNRMLRRNLEGLLSKCHRYGQLRGVELGIYIDYTERGQFVSYETQNFCRNEITAKQGHPSSQNYLPDCLPAGVQKKLIGTASQLMSARRPQTAISRPVSRSGTMAASLGATAMPAVKAFPLNKLPSLPSFNFVTLESSRGGIY